ncbi:MAG: molybdopterin-dependent oxidoreductase [Acidobacteria bacterium]|nr:molybdopterin-dependent oxidoreductase [Acidobacteriota bacterium]
MSQRKKRKPGMPELPPLKKTGTFNEIDRRNFLSFMLASGTAAMVGCATQGPSAVLVSNVNPPEEWIPGKSVYYASVCRECPAGCGLHVCNRDGRVTKVEGNPHHPVNRGTLCARGQASLQGLYNPDRLKTPLQRSGSGQLEPSAWKETIDTLAAALSELGPQRDASSLVFFSDILGPSFSALVGKWMETIGGGRLIQHEACGYEFLKAANRFTFDREEVPGFSLENARFILSLGSDFLETWLSPVEFSSAFSRFKEYQQGRIGRLVQIESRCSLTGANADDWLLIQPGTEPILVLALIHIILAEKLGRVGQEDLARIESLAAPFNAEKASEITGISSDVIYDLARSFAHERPSLALFGGVSSISGKATLTQAAVNLLNYVVGNIGETVLYGADLYPARLNSYRDVLQLIDEMNAGKVNVLVIHRSNPAYDLPFTSGFQSALEKVPLVVVLSPHLSETAARADLVLPIHTPLEAWDDYSPREGVWGLQQPTMRPLLDTRHAGDLLLQVANQLSPRKDDSPLPQNYYQFLRERWRELQARERPDLEFESFWNLAATGGGVWKDFSSQPVSLSPSLGDIQVRDLLSSETVQSQELTLIPYSSVFNYDGRGSNSAWLQELPQSLTEVVWDSCVEIHPETAQKLGLKQGDVARLRSEYGEILLPVYVQRWIHPDAVAVPLGQGHTHFGRYANGRGANVASLLNPAAEAGSGGLPWLSVNVQVQKANARHQLVTTRGELSQGQRQIAQTISLNQMQKFFRTGESEGSGNHETANLYPPHQHPAHQWGMAIDLNACTGCKACVVACYAENNNPVVGKDQVARGREMSWIRVESYAEPGPLPGYTFLPVLCQHCHHAPCEGVCPVFATYHNPEGLNAMVYNRCVGTRYCANNCPYKARRFNFHEPEFPSALDRQLNPHVTVRIAGVMEKCTFCVQRIVEAKQQAEKEGRNLMDGEVMPACAQTCPTRAIVFGDLNDRESLVSKRSRDPRAYHLLEHLGTRPAITYLKKIRL